MQTDLNVLTDEEVLQFHKDGFVVREGFLSPEQIRAASDEGAGGALVGAQRA